MDKEEYFAIFCCCFLKRRLRKKVLSFGTFTLSHLNQKPPQVSVKENLFMTLMIFFWISLPLFRCATPKCGKNPSPSVFSNLNTETGKHPPGSPGDQHTRRVTWPNVFPSSKLNRYQPAGTDCLKAPALLVDTRRLLLPPGSACKHKHKVQTPKIPFDDADQKAPTTFWFYMKSSSRLQGTV